MLSENALKVYEYVKENEGNNITAADIAEALGLGVKSVNGIITSAFGKTKGIMERVPAEMEVTDETGKISHKAIKLIKLTEAGRSFDPDKTDAE